jgi:hypothetical protein
MGADGPLGAMMAQVENATEQSALATEQQAQQLAAMQTQTQHLAAIAGSLESIAASLALVDQLARHPGIAALLDGESFAKAAMRR